MARLISAAECVAVGVGAGLATTDLERLIDQEEAEIVRRFGAHTAARTEDLEPARDAESLYLSRAASAITSVTEYQFLGDTAPLTRAATDYVLFAGQGRLVRTAGSLAWGRLVTVVYTPVDDTSLRKAVLLDLVRVAVGQAADPGGGGEEIIGDMGARVSIKGAGKVTDWAEARRLAYGRLGWLS